jgi:diguanylate cyclase
MTGRSRFSLAQLFASPRRSREPARPGEPSPGAPSGLARFADDHRRRLLEDISGFLLGNRLAVNPANLALAWEAFSGASPGLGRRIAERSAGGEDITQEWLDAIAAETGAEAAADELRLMFEELDEGVRRFARTTTAARSVTSEYRTDLDRHVLELGHAARAAEETSRLAALARAMAERTRRAEADLRAREEEAKTLRRRLGKARRDAERDQLTGLPNRRAFEAELTRLHAEAAASRQPLSLAFCDIDHFKRVNDTHGHEAGDRVLRLIAQVLARSSNDNCHVSRHGGEEFVLLFRGLTPSEAKLRLDAAREDLAARSLLNRDSGEPFGQVTFSAGIASVAGHADPRAALKAADGALYRAKQAGRNRVLVA